jgi:hypothetical protein
MLNKRSGWIVGVGLMCWLSFPQVVGGASAPGAHKGPFGISMGEPISQLGPVRLVRPGRYIVLHPTEIPAGIDSVTVDAYPSTGVCAIRGTSPTSTDDETGARLREKVDKFAEALKAKYGPYVKTEDCKGLEEECQNLWVQRIANDQADYSYDFDLMAAKRPDAIEEIVVAASAADSITSFVQIEYYSANHDACDAAQKAADGAGL